MSAAGRAWFLTGEPGVGKTSVVLRTVQLLRHEGVVVGGVVSREMRAHGQRIGFELRDLGRDRVGVLASADRSVGPRVGRYRVDLANVAEVGAGGLQAALAYAQVIVCDEVGPMELFSPEFRRAVEAALASPKPVLGVVHQYARDPLAMRIRSGEFGQVIEVTYTNRERLAEDLRAAMLPVARSM